MTLGRLRQIETAEEILYDLDFRQVRVRTVGGGARVEVGRSEIARLERLWTEVVPRLEAVGFVHSELDPVGYRTGGASLPAISAPETS